jgi:dimethylargininase
MFKNAIVRRPTKSVINGISNAKLGLPDYKLALTQHDNYIETLRKCGLEVEVLEANENFPDWVFIEDVALLTKKCAIVTNPGTPSRNKETIGIKETLSKYYNNIEKIVSPGTLDGGDIMMVEDHFYIGLSDRTNTEGANQLIAILEKHELAGSVVNLDEVLHLKTGVNYLDNNNLLVSGEFIDKMEFKDFNKYIIPNGEEYAANSLWINGKVIVPTGFVKTKKLIEEIGYEVIGVDVSEFRKLDGGLSCLSLRF